MLLGAVLCGGKDVYYAGSHKQDLHQSSMNNTLQIVWAATLLTSTLHARHALAYAG